MKKQSLLILLISVLFILSAAGMYYALQAWMPFISILLGTGVSGLVYLLFQERRLILDFLGAKTTQQGLSMGTVIILVLIIIGFINYFSVKFSKVWDFSFTSQYTLSDKSKKVLDSLEQDLQIRYFYKEGLQNIDLTKKSFLSQAQVFKTYSPRVIVGVHEMNSNPALVEVYGANKGTGEGFVSYKGKNNRIESQYSGNQGEVYTEQSFINAIIKTTREKQKKIYFLSGHGESDTDNDKLEKGFSYFKTSLLKNSYKVDNLNILNTGKIPEDADVLVIAGGSQTFQKSEFQILNEYIVSGKPLLIFLQNQPSESLKEILKNTGWKLGSDSVYNILNSQQGPVIAKDQATVVNQFSIESDISKEFNEQKSILFFSPHPLVPEVSEDNEKKNNEIFLKSSNQSVALNSDVKEKYKGVPQSYNMATYWRGIYPKGSKNSQIVFFSDVSIGWNQFFYQANNKDLLLASVASLANEKDLISLEIKEPNKTPLKMLGPEFNSYFRIIVLALFLPLPLLFLILSIVVWFRQRHA